MKGLPDCVHCDAADSLEVIRLEPYDVRLCLCTVCSKECRVNSRGRVVKTVEQDIAGVLIDGD